MAWWRAKVVAAVRRAWLSVAGRSRALKDDCIESGDQDSGILKLHEEVQNCGYQDVQVMWNILSADREARANKQKKRSFWKLSFCAVRSPRTVG